MLSIPITAERATGDVRKRRATRHRIETLAYADLGPGNGGFPINISEMGMAFQGILPLEKNQVICIKVKLPGMKDVVETTGQVIWLNDLGKGGGLQFINLAEESARLLNHWLSLQTHTGSRIESVPVSPPEVEKKEFRFSAPLSPAGRERTSVFQSDLNFTSLSSSSNLLSSNSTVTSGATADNKSMARPRHSEREDESAVGSSESKRIWIIPFMTGLITSVAIMIAVMWVYGVISIQFRWPQQIADASSVRPLTETRSARVVDTPSKEMSLDEPMSDPVAPAFVASTLPLTPISTSPIAETPPQEVTAPEPLRSKTTSAPKVDATKPLIQPYKTPKDMLPNPVAPARILDTVLPTVAAPTQSDSVPQLYAASPVILRPAPPVSSSAAKTRKLDAPVLIKRKDPVYSSAAREKGISGDVELHFIIDANGNVRNVSVIKGNPLLVRAALEAIPAWHYQPARLDGIPVEAESSVVFNFRP